VCFLDALVLSLLAGPRLVRRYPQAQRPWVAVVWALAGASLCKGILDGGPLGYDTVAAWLAVVCLSKGTTLQQAAAWLAGRWVLLGLVLALWLAVVAAIEPAFIGFQGTCLLYRVALYALVLSVPALWAGGRARRVAAATVGLSAVAVAAFGYDSARRNLLPLLAPAPTWAVQYAAGPDGVSAKAVAVPAGCYLDLYRRLGEAPQRVRWVSAGRNRSSAPTGFYADLVVLASADQAVLTRSGLVAVRRAERLADRSGPAFRLEVEFDAALGPVLWGGPDVAQGQLEENERQVAYRLLDAQLRAAGVTEYVLIPLAQYRRTSPRAPATQVAGGG
jgi:hypothetical protein